MFALTHEETFLRKVLADCSGNEGMTTSGFPITGRTYASCWRIVQGMRGDVACAVGVSFRVS